MKEKLLNIFGTFGTIIYFAIQIIIYTLPFIMIRTNFFLSLILIAANSLIPFASVIFWIWGLVCAITGPQDVFAIIYYAVFVVIWLPFFISSIISFFSKR